MRRYPHSWKNTFTSLGFRLKAKPKKRSQSHRKAKLETLERRELLAADILVNTHLDVVNANDDLMSLREAVSEAHANGTSSIDVIGFDSLLEGRDIEIKDGEIVLNSNLTIQGNGTTKISAKASSGSSRLFSVPNGSEVTIEDVILADGDVSGLGNGDDSGGAITTAGSLTLSHVTLEDNAADWGGAIFVSAGDLIVVNSTFRNNTADYGGALRVEVRNAGTTNVSSSVFHHNSAIGGGAVYLNGGGSSPGSVFFVNSTLSSNRASSYGGGMATFRDSNLAMVHSTIAMNLVSGGVGGGGIYSNFPGAAPVILNSIIDSNTHSLRPNTAFFNDAEISVGSTGNMIGAGTQLHPLGNYGGTTLSHKVVAGTGTVDGAAYSGPGTPLGDQRGFSRSGTTFIAGALATPVDTTAGDYDGDGKQDEAFYDSATGRIQVLTDLHRSHVNSAWAHPIGAGWEVLLSGDFDGDGRDDLLLNNDGDWRLAISEGTYFNLYEDGVSDWDNVRSVEHGDFDGDGADEIIVVNSTTDTAAKWDLVNYERTSGVSVAAWSRFQGGTLERLGYDQDPLYILDVDRDGLEDVIAWNGTEWIVGMASMHNGQAEHVSTYGYGDWFNDSYDVQNDQILRDVRYDEALDIFQGVYNTIEPEVYKGIKKGSQATKETQRGNNWDQSLLLQELLADAGFDSRIAIGTAKIESDVAQSLFGVNTVDAASAIFHVLKINTPHSYSSSTGEHSFGHAWVRAEVPTATGLSYANFDPFFKERVTQDGIVVDLSQQTTNYTPDASIAGRDDRGTFDELGFLTSTGGDVLPAEWYEEQVAEYLALNFPGTSLTDVPLLGDIEGREFDRVSEAQLPQVSLGVPATLVKQPGLTVWESIKDNSNNQLASHRVRVTLSADNSSLADWQQDFFIPDVSLSSITLERHGGDIYIRQGETLLTSLTESGRTGAHTLTLKHAAADQTFAAVSDQFEFAVFDDDNTAEVATISLHAGQYSDEELNRRREALNDAAADGVAGADVRHALDYISAKYWHDAHEGRLSAADLLQTLFVGSAVESGVVSSKREIIAGSFDYLQTPVLPVDAGVDYPNGRASYISSNQGLSSGAQAVAELFQLNGYQNSAMENAVLEDVLNSESISTIRGLINAYNGGNENYTGLPLTNLRVLESVEVSGGGRKLYYRGDLGVDAENPYSPTITTAARTIDSKQDLINLFPGHSLNPPENNATANPRIAKVWDGLMTGVTGDAVALVPKEFSVAGTSDSNWIGSVYLLANSNGDQYAIGSVDGGPVTNGGFLGNYVNPLNTFQPPAATNFTNYAGDPVNVANGNMFRDEVDIVMPNMGVALDFTRHYDSQSQYDIGLGPGWVHSFSDRLLQKNGTTDELVWLTSGGQRYTFTETSPGNWESPSTLLGTLHEVSGDYEYRSDNGMVYKFETPANPGGGGDYEPAASDDDKYVARLKEKVDQNGNGVVLTYDASSPYSLDEVEDKNSSVRRLLITSSASPGGGLISEIEKRDSTGLLGTWTFAYGTGGASRFLKSVTNPEQEVVAYDHYLGHGNLEDGVIKRIDEPDGAYHAYEYYPNGWTFRVTEGINDGGGDVEKSSHSFSYDLFRHVTEFTDDNGNVEKYYHRNDGMLLKHVRGDGSRTTSTFGVDDGMGEIIEGTEHLMTSTTDEVGAIQTFTYFDTSDFKDRRLKTATSKHYLTQSGAQVSPEDIATTTFAYAQATGLSHVVNPTTTTTVSDGDTRVSTNDYDSLGRLELSEDANGDITAYTYYTNGLVESVVDARNYVLNSSPTATTATYFQYDVAGNLTNTNAFNTSIEEATHHHTGQVKVSTDATDRELHSSYDDLGRMVSSSQRGENGTATALTTYYTYDERGRVDVITDPLGRETHHEYDYRGNLVKQTFADGTTNTFEYDSKGNEIASTDAKGQTTRYVYDERDRIVQTIYADGTNNYIRYTGTGNIAAAIDANGNETRFSYNARGQVLTTTQGYGTTEASTVTNVYDGFGQLAETIDGEGDVTGYFYDDVGRLTKTLQYARSGGVVNRAIAPKAASTRHYDANGNLVKTAFYDGARVSLSLVLNGNADTLLADSVANHSDHVRETHYTYDDLNRLEETRVIDPGGMLADLVTETQYDAAGRVRYAIDELGRTGETKYDTYGRVSETIAPDPDLNSGLVESPKTKYAYDAAGNRIATTDPLGHVTEFKYDDLNRLVTTTDAEGRTTEVVHDVNGQTIAAINAAGVMASYTLLDERGREVRQYSADPDRVDQDGNGIDAQAAITSHKYDAAGNRISTTDARGYQTFWTYDSHNRVVTEGGEFVWVIDDSDNFDGGLVVHSTAGIASTLNGGDPTDSAYRQTQTEVKRTNGQARRQFILGKLPAGRYSTSLTWLPKASANTKVDFAVRRDSDEVKQLNNIDQSASPDQFIRNDDGTDRTWAGNVVFTANGNQTISIDIQSDTLGTTSKPSYVLVDAILLKRLSDGKDYSVQQQFVYDGAGRISKEIDADGNETDYTYTELGQIASTTQPDPDGTGDLNRPETRFVYDPFGNLTEQRRVRDSVVVRTDKTDYNYLNQPWRSFTNFGSDTTPNDVFESRRLYDDAGNIIRERRVVEADGAYTWVYEFNRYDDLNRLVEKSYVANQGVVDHWTRKVQYVYDDNSRVIAEVAFVREDINASASYSGTTFAYDDTGRLLSESENSIFGTQSPVTKTVYDVVGNVIYTIDATGFVTRNEYDQRQQRVFATLPSKTPNDPSTPQTKFTYNVAGELVATEDALGHTTEVWRSRSGQEIRTTAADGTQNASYFNLLGNLQAVVDPNKNLTHYEYDSLNRLVSETIEIDGVEKQRLYRYDDNGNVRRIVDRDGRVRQFAYDGLDRRTIEAWYDNEAEAITKLNADRRAKLTWEYDKLGRVTSTDVVQQVGHDYEEYFKYDHLNRLTETRNYNVSAQYSTPAKLNYTYDLPSTATDGWYETTVSPTYFSGSISIPDTIYTTDKLGRTSKIVDIADSSRNVSAKTFDFIYDDAGRLELLERDTENFELDTHYFYDNYGRLGSYYQSRTLAGAGSPTTFDSTGLTRDNRSNVTKVQNGTSELSGGTVAFTDDYTYDAIGQLATWDWDYDDFSVSGTLDSTGSRTLAHDDAGNLTTDANATNFTIDDHNRLDTGGDYTYTYDGEGNVTERLHTSGSKVEYEWDHRNRLKYVKELNSSGGQIQRIHYAYNNDNLRVRKTVFNAFNTAVESKTYIYDRGQLTSVLKNNLNSSGTPLITGRVANRYLYAPGVDQLLVDEAFTETLAQKVDETNWAITDHQGSVTTVLDEDGDLVEHRTYDPFGQLDTVVDANKQAVALDALATDIAFAGREWDADAELSYNRQRWYDPSTSRFLSEDPAEADANLYRYAGNDPVNYRDPSGLRAAGNPLDNLSKSFTNFAAPSVNYSRQSNTAQSPSGQRSGGLDSPLTRQTVVTTTVPRCISCHNPIIAHGGSIKDTPRSFQISAGRFVRSDNLDTIDSSISSLRTTGAISRSAAATGAAIVAAPVSVPFSVITAGALGFTTELGATGDFGNAADNIPLVGLRHAPDQLSTTLNSDASHGERVIAALSLGLNLAEAFPAVSKSRQIIKNGYSSYQTPPLNILPSSAGSQADNLVVDSYDLLRRQRDISGQAHHLNQDAAYRSRIAKGDGVSIKLSGNAFTDVGSPHYNAHESLESFWDIFRRGGLDAGNLPTNSQYNRALYNGLQESGLSPTEAIQAVRAAKAQQLDAGLRGVDLVPRLPSRINQVKRPN